MALRMRVNISAIGSVSMFERILLPTGFAHAGNQTLVGEFAKTNPADAELAIHGPRTAANLAAPLESRREFWRQLRLCEFGFTGHEFVSMGNSYFFFSFFGSSVWNGKPIWASSSRDSSSLAFRITNVMFMPCTRVNLSGFSSGKTSCSDRPRL